MTDKLLRAWPSRTATQPESAIELRQHRGEALVGTRTALTYFLMALIFGVISFINLSTYLDDHKPIRIILFVGYAAVVVAYLVRSYRARKGTA